jgi:hypothetical protein
MLTGNGTPNTSQATPAPATTQAEPAQRTQSPGQSIAQTLAAKAAESVAAPVTQEEKPDLSNQFAVLSRREQKLLEEKQKIDELRKKYEKFEKVNPKENPLALLEAAGISLDELIQAQLKAGQPPTEAERYQTLEEKLKAFEERERQKEEQSKQEHINKAVQAFKDQIKAHVDTDPGKYELIHAHDAYDQIYEVCEQYFFENKDKPGFKPLEISKAADLVEDFYFEQAREKYSKVSKYKKLFVPEDAPAQTPNSPFATDTKTQATDTPKPQTEPTLTNRGSTPSAQNSKLLPREIAIKQIAAQFDRKL